MELFYILPEEIWIEIILMLPCQKIIEICEIVEFKELCYKNNLIELRKMKDYPRNTRYCKFHEHTFSDNIYPETLHKKSMNEIANLLYELNFDLVRGDIINLGHDETGINKILIFDGCNLKYLYYIDGEYSVIPQEFIILNNNIPINYWYKHRDYICYISIDHSYVRKECISNVIYNKEKDLVFTNFYLNNINYVIKCVYDEYDLYYGYNECKKDKKNNRNKIIKIFINKLSENILLIKYSKNKLVLKLELKHDDLESSDEEY